MPAISRKCLALLLTITLLLGLVGSASAESTTAGPTPAPFWDTIGTRFQEAVDALYALKVVAGKSETAFEPGAGVTRAEMAALVVRSLGKESTSATATSFPDVGPGHWAAGPIGVAADLGIVLGGTDGLFRPNESVTYPQAVAMLLRSLGLEANAGSYPTGYVMLAKSLKLIDGLDWGLDRPASRGDVALMLYRAIFTVPVGGFGSTLSQSVFRHAASLSILPATEVLPLGTSSLSVKAVDRVGTTLDVPVSWAVTTGDAVVNSDGALSITGDAPVTISARAGSVTASKTYTVIRKLTVTADHMVTAASSQVTLIAIGTTGAGANVAVTPDWKIVGGAGTITPGGVLAVQGTKPVIVQAAVGSLTATTTVYIGGSVSISPTVVTSAPGKDVQFTATVTDGTGTPISVTPTWSVTGTGTIEQSGLFHAGTGSATVVARAGEQSATATVKVADHMQVSPNGGTFKKGDSLAFTATAVTGSGESLTVPVQWSVEPPSLGFASADGKFFAADSGSGYLVASYKGLTGKVPVSVAGAATALQVTTFPSAMPSNGSSTATITVRLIDSKGITASGVDNVFVSISSSNLGILDKSVAPVVNGVATVTLTAGTIPGTYTIIASAPGSMLASASTSFTTTTPAVDHIALEVYPNPIAADAVSRTTVTAKLVDATGSAIANNTGAVQSINLSASNTAAGTLNSTLIQIYPGQQSGTALFTAGTAPGATVISGSANFRVTPATVIGQIVGAAHRLKIRAGTTVAKADGSTELPITVELQDVNGNVRTGDNSVLVSMTATSGNYTIPLPSQMVNWGVTTFKLKSTVSGAFAVNAWAPNAAVQSDSSQVSFTAGSPYKLVLSVEPNSLLSADARTVATLRAKILDLNGNFVNTAANSIRFVREAASRNVTAVPAATTITAINGEATLQITTGSSVGSDYFHVESDNLLQSSAVVVTTQITGVPVRVLVQPLTDTSIAAGTSSTVKVWVLDQMNQLVTGDGGRPVFLSATNGAAVSGTGQTSGGVATFAVTSTQAGNTVLTASSAGLTPDSTGRTLSVISGAPDHVILTASPEALSADGYSVSNITARLVDKFGNNASGSATVSLTPSTSNFVTLNGGTIVTGGVAQLIAKTTPGTTTIAGTAGGYAVNPLTFATYIPGIPTRVVLDPMTSVVAGNGFSNQVVAKARILDQNGNLVTSLSTGTNLTAMALRVSGSGSTNTTNLTLYNATGLNSHGISPDGVTIGGATVVNGIATFTVTNTRAETISLTPIVYYGNTLLEGVPGTMTTTVGPAYTLTVSSSISTAMATIPTSITVTATVTDSYGNPVNSTNPDSITFSSGNSPYVTMPSPTTVPTSTGSSSIVVMTKTDLIGGPTTITAVSSLYGFSGAVSIVTDRVPDKPIASAWDNNGIDNVISGGELGARVVVTVAGRRSAQKVFVYVNGVVVPVFTDLSGVTALDTIPAGSTTMIGYIRRSDLGVVLGLKDIRAVVQTPLGMSPLSDSALLNVLN